MRRGKCRRSRPMAGVCRVMVRFCHRRIRIVRFYYHRRIVRFRHRLIMWLRCRRIVRFCCRRSLWFYCRRSLRFRCRRSLWFDCGRIFWLGRRILRSAMPVAALRSGLDGFLLLRLSAARLGARLSISAPGRRTCARSCHKTARREHCSCENHHFLLVVHVTPCLSPLFTVSTWIGNVRTAF